MVGNLNKSKSAQWIQLDGGKDSRVNNGFLRILIHVQGCVLFKSTIMGLRFVSPGFFFAYVVPLYEEGYFKTRFSPYEVQGDGVGKRMRQVVGNCNEPSYHGRLLGRYREIINLIIIQRRSLLLSSYTASIVYGRMVNALSNR